MEPEPEPEETPTDEFVNYMPAMPTLSGDQGILGRLADVLSGRRA